MSRSLLIATGLKDAEPPALAGKPAPLRSIVTVNMHTAEQIAFQSLQVAQRNEPGDEEEARALLGDAGEFLAQIGGPRRPQSAEEIYQWCAAKRVGEV